MLIALEGLEGVGKTTLGQSIAARMGGTYIKSPPSEMNQCRGFISSVGMHQSNFYFYLSSLFAMQPQIQELVASGGIVFADRYLGSTIAYHANGNDFEPPKFDASGLRLPDLSVHIRCDEASRERRITERGFHIFDRTPCNEPAILRHFEKVCDIEFVNDASLEDSVTALTNLLTVRLREHVKSLGEHTRF